MNEEEVLVKIECVLDCIIFPRPEEMLGRSEDHTFGITKWDILKVIDGKILDNVITIKGEFTSPLEYGKNYIILAKEVYHEKYGKQYDLLYITQNVNFKNVSQQKNFLSSILTPLQLEEMFKTYENPIELIKSHDVEALKKIKGVGDYIANCIIDRYEENKDASIIYIKLAKIGLTPKMIQKLIKTYKDPQKVVSVVLENPYKLTYDVDGIGFKTADGIALRAGISSTSSYRISSFINYYLEEKAQEGGSFVYANELLYDLYDYFDGKENIFENIVDENNNVVGNNINKALEDLQERKVIAIEEAEIKKNRRIYLIKYYNLEKKIAKNLLRIQNSKGDFDYSNWEERIKELEEKQGFSFTQEQKDGIKLGLDNQVCFITGLAGSGKSTLVSGILSSLNRYSFRQCALSGKAASRLQEVTGEDGSTIHRLLEYNPSLGFVKNAQNPLLEKIIILDEISLVGEELFENLLEAIPNGTKLIMLGDMGQLESIGEGNLAYDIYNSEIIPTVELTKVQRQAQKSGIITIAHEVRHQNNLFEKNQEGKFTFGELKDMHFDVSLTSENNREKVIKYFTRMYNSNIVKKDIMNIQLISPVKERGDACVFNLNQDAQEIVNPRSLYKESDIITVKLSKDKSFEIRPNDKVMCIKNNYKTQGVSGNICPIFNGWTGVVSQIFNNNIVINFPLATEQVVLSKADIKSELILGYASTCHKMQGSSAKAVIGVIDYSTPPSMLTSQLLYTLMTRAKLQCVIVGQNKAIAQAISTDFVSEKQTFLQEFLSEKS